MHTELQSADSIADKKCMSGHPGPRQYIIACGLQQQFAPTCHPFRL